jgi:diguanylate cyclase
MKSDSGLREKYLDTLARLESAEARAARVESVLRLLVGRLCLAARGRAARLDGELRSLSDLLRRQASADEIEAHLEPLSRAVAALDEQPRSAPEPAPAAAERTRPTPATSPQPAAPPTPAPPPNAASGALPAAAQTPAASSAQTRRDERIEAAIVGMLERLTLLPELRPALAELNERSIGELSAEELADGLERVARLLGEQRGSLQREKTELEELLRQIDVRLEELATHLAGESAEQQSAQDSSNRLNLLVMEEVNELNTDVQRAVDLGHLRAQVRVRLEAINTHLQDFRAREQERSTTQQDRTGRLRVRIAELEHESRNLQHSLQEEQRLAMIDALTGIANRAAYDDRIEHEFARWQRSGIPVSILAWDIDRFKAINDAYGHKAGDKVLRVIGQHLAQHVRGTDFVARYGGEEFVMLLLGASADQALVAADKMRDSIAKIGFHFRSKPVTVTASCGITTFRTDDTPDAVFDRADRALYQAKDAGRNCCVIV